MYETRDDTLPRANEVLAHFKRNVQNEALTKMRNAFKAAWTSPVTVTNPLHFKVSVWFGRVLPDDIIKAIHAELKEHGWDTYALGLATPDNGSEQHFLGVTLNPLAASPYA